MTQEREATVAKKKKANPFLGRWRITWMEQWDQDFVDEEEEGYFEFDKQNLGQFHFGYVHGHMDYRLTTRDEKPALEFSWEGNDEMDPVSGRGWVVADGDRIEGELYIHGGDSSAFRATRKKRP
jgi:hypothetical protein